jgi:DNA-3-methyladenine glycosylase
MKLGQDFYTRSSVTLIARELLGKYIFTRFEDRITAGMISETEAYEGITDQASHAYNNRRTTRTEVMFAKGGVAYVYLCYGVHHLFNIVTNNPDIPHAVLLRGIIPAEGISIMEKRTGKKYNGKGFTDGPGKVSQALGIRVAHSGISLSGEMIWIEDKGITVNSNDIKVGPRIGIPYANEDALLQYRFLLSPNMYP